MNRVCVFCGSSLGARSEYSHAAAETGALLAGRGLALVYGGGHVGLMGVVADAALRAGGSVIGVITQALVDREVAHSGLTELHIVHTMHERKALMASLADAFLVLPGGIGTMEEFFEVWTWGQLGEHAKPVGLVNVAGYFNDLIRFLDHAVDEELLKPKHRGMLIVADSPAAVLDAFAGYQPPTVGKWIGRNEI
ncbi:MAG TPA: TIGR00730 family Rossman fold protein [Gemmataceae bacterium]|nr:TIGR00730 family Rossman fold protein [Gemmataceae bacterium]